jgi:hypothetical protein
MNNNLDAEASSNSFVLNFALRGSSGAINHNVAGAQVLKQT